MRAPWRLARSICSARPSRLALLSAAVCMSVVLIGVVAVVMSSLNAALVRQIDAQIGTAEVRVRALKGGSMPAPIADTVRTWDGVERVLPRLQQTLTLATRQTTLVEGDDGVYRASNEPYRTSVFVNGVVPEREFESRPVRILNGRAPERDNEIMIDARVAQRLSWAHDARDGVLGIMADPLAYLGLDAPDEADTARDERAAAALNKGIGPRVGDTLLVARLFAPSAELEIVGIAQSPPMGGKPMGYTTIGTLDALARQKGRLTDIELSLAEGIDPEAFVARHKGAFEGTAIIQTTERVTAGVEQNLAASQLAFVVISIISLLSAAFIIMTGLTTGLAEQQRTLGVLRCVGATRAQLAQAQLLVGVIVSAIGTAAGLPMGLAIAWILSRIFERQLTEGVVIDPKTLALTIGGALVAGLVGAMWPAWRASRLTPMEAVNQPVAPGHSVRVLGVTLAGLAGLAAQALIVALVPGQAFFWLYVTIGLPLMFVGYFLISVPIIVLVARFVGPAITRALRLPPRLLTRTVRGTPYRHGFTAGALMTGMALLIGIWTNSSAAMRDWIDRIQFPDAFAYGIPLKEEAIGIVEGLDFVNQTSAINMVAVETDAFGVEAIQQYRTNYFGFEPRPFFDMVSVEFVQGDRETALDRLEQGGAVIVAREFLVARGLGVGDEFVCRDEGGDEHRFEIVGVVTTPGLELVSQFFDLGDNLVTQAVSSVFGSRADMIEHFGVREPMLIQIDLDDSLPARQAVARIEDALAGAGVLNVGSGQRIRAQIEAVFTSSFVVVSTIALGAMLVACFGVANLIVAEIHARRYELGVLRAVGASKGQLVRLVCGQALVIAIGACVSGTLLGLQAAWGGQQMNRVLLGIDLTMSPPMGAIAIAWAAALVLALGAAAPSAIRVNRATIRRLMSPGGL